MTSQQIVRVELGDRSYNVVVGPGVRSQIANVVPATAKRAVIVTQANIPFSVEESFGRSWHFYAHHQHWPR